MKKFIISLILICFATLASAQTDTLVIRTPITFDVEVLTSKTGNSYTKYYVYYQNEYYETTKVSYERYQLITRFGGTPCVVLITTEKPKKRKILVL